jgi:hypothetical protein
MRFLLEFSLYRPSGVGFRSGFIFSLPVYPNLFGIKGFVVVVICCCCRPTGESKLEAIV